MVPPPRIINRKRPAARGDFAIHSTVARPLDPDRLVDAVVVSLDDDKAEEVTVIDLRGRSSLADHMVIATGKSQRQVGAMADHLSEKLKSAGLPVSIEGMPQGDWVLIDAGDILVHLFRPDVRSFYNLEKMWAAAGPGRIEEKSEILTA